jgi:antitoxin component YwqK of YwqJK toxin-antitoxin module
MVVTSFYAMGQFSIENDTIKLIDSLTQKKFFLLRKGEEKLIVLKCDKVPAGQVFLCWTKFYPNGEVKFTGGWDDDKKDGGWRYFDEQGNETSVNYENGEVKPINEISSATDTLVSSPTFPGGFDSLNRYIKENYKWHEQFSIEGIVYVQFTVSETGSVVEPSIVRGLCKPCDKEALRLIKGMPNWNPATVNGKVKAEKMFYPIKFGLTNPYR